MAPLFTGLKLGGFGKNPDVAAVAAGNNTATGGTVYPAVTIEGTSYNVHRFTSTVSPSTFILVGSTLPNARILVVGGGGAGGSFNPGAYGGGGGGAGGVRYIPSVTLPAGTYPIKVGPGGTGGNPYLDPKNGGDIAQPFGGGSSSIFNGGNSNGIPAITATGGGAGGGGGGVGGSGGSGGGASYPGPRVAPGNVAGNDPRSNPISEGNPSEVSKSTISAGSYGCGGGGGAGPASTPTGWQTGHPGITLPGIGSPGNPWLPPAGNIFAGGGGGSSYKETEGNGSGGPGGGGPAPGTSGTSSTGGGGGGRGVPSGNGGDGGSGVIYVIIPTAYTSSPGPG
jgi:hypothetical protein